MEAWEKSERSRLGMMSLNQRTAELLEVSFGRVLQNFVGRLENGFGDVRVARAIVDSVAVGGESAFATSFTQRFVPRSFG